MCVSECVCVHVRVWFCCFIEVLSKKDHLIYPLPLTINGATGLSKITPPRVSNYRALCDITVLTSSQSHLCLKGTETLEQPGELRSR